MRARWEQNNHLPMKFGTSIKSCSLTQTRLICNFELLREALRDFIYMDD